MRPLLLAAVLLLVLHGAARSQGASPFNWQFCYGGAFWEWSTHISPTPDGGHILSFSSNYLVYPSFGGAYAYAIKLSPTGQPEWQRKFGGAGNDVAGPIVPHPDGGYLYLISTASADIPGHHGAVDSPNRDLLVLRLDAAGTVKWQRCYGDGRNEKAYSVRFDGDGGYTFTGLHFPVSDNIGFSGSVWQFKTDSLGQPLSEKSFPAGDVREIVTTTDGGFLASYSTGVFGLRKWDSAGTLLWSRVYPGAGGYCQQMKTMELPGGGLLLIGDNYDYSSSWQAPGGSQDFQLIRTDAGGNVQWRQLYGGSDGDNAYAAAVCENGDFLVAGTAASDDGQLDTNRGYYDCWVIRVRSTDGSLRWKKSFGGSDSDDPRYIRANGDGTITVGGTTRSQDGDVGPHPGGGDDLWVFNFREPVDGLSVAASSAGPLLRISPNPATDQLQVTLPAGAGGQLLTVLDPAGRQLLTVKAASAQTLIDVSRLSPGVYLLRCDGTNAALRFVKH